MDFYVEPAFFVLCAPIAIIACVMGVLERPLKRYSLVVSVVMLFLLFFRTPGTLIYAAVYLAVSVALYGVALWSREDSSRSEDAPHGMRSLPYGVLVGVQLLPLVAYKVGVLVRPDFPGFLGISYITFKAVQVLLEVHDGLITDMTYLEYLGFLSFFPTFTSGPIMRSRAYVQDVRTPLSRDGYLDRLYRGLGWFVLGALYKFVGAALAQWFMWFVPVVVGGGVLGWLVTVFGYGMDLFFDFAGYSDMAMGLGLVLGVEVPRNFRAPFVATDIKEFWDRWHISLSTWLRDFVFMRFSQFAISHKLFKSRLTCACVGFMLNMVLMGAWHGITPDYLVYGLYHGLLLAGCHAMQKKWKFYKAHRRDRWFMVASWAVTMVAVFFGFALFGGYVVTPLLG
ncbi:MAG: D-alanyl-lipoteichoic acid biosynthesis protein DltB [Atopobiaceae bacterium]|nr:D-alanyl-lipoteichoic acid biosynthesis protein DltB [Atopobiaceae bacterium]MBR3315832.1 D-alanyl-lipoteichoic acid biosynthesis protein DltB [Atopobiaceae bacterium]